jgi:hypothetical protein
MRTVPAQESAAALPRLAAPLTVRTVPGRVSRPTSARGVNSVEGADGRDTEPVARETHAIACAANRVARDQEAADWLGRSGSPSRRGPRLTRGYGDLVLDLSSLDLEEIAAALADQTDYEHRWLINTETGEIVFWTSDTGIDGQTAVDLDELDLLCIDPLPSSIWYQDMAEFAAYVSDEQAGRRLARAIQGKGAFRRFRAELHEEFPQLLPAWYAFRDARAHRRAVEWLADNSLITDVAATRFLDEHPEPSVP